MNAIIAIKFLIFFNLVVVIVIAVSACPASKNAILSNQTSMKGVIGDVLYACIDVTATLVRRTNRN